MTVSSLPFLNAFLNLVSTMLLAVGYVLIKRRNREAHKFSMVSAFVCSCLFLISYLIYHYHAGSVPYQGPWRGLYLFILITHIILAALVPFLALRTLYWAWKGEFSRHKEAARWTWPIWMYVSVTGVFVYLFLYVFPTGS